MSDSPITQFSPEPTEANFREQAEALDLMLKGAAESEPNNPCRNIEEYVASFRHSGTGKMYAPIQLAAHGFPALGTEAGVQWLLANYPETVS